MGSAYIRRLLQDPKNVCVNVDKMSPCSAKHPISSSENYIFVKGDITEPGLLLKLLLLYEIDHVVHFAAQSHVCTSFTNSDLYVQDIIMGTHRLLEALKEIWQSPSRVKPVLTHISTDEVAPSDHDAKAPQTEEAVLKPTNPYSACKACAEMLIHSYQKSYGLPIRIIRSNNTFGGKQFKQKVIPRFIDLLSRDQPLTIHGDGSQKRSFIYVEDFVDALMLIVDKGEVGQIHNIGSSTEVTVLELAQTLSELMSKPLQLQFIPDRPHNDIRYWIDCSRLKKLGWEQKTSFKEGLQRTIDWYRDEAATDYFVEDYDASKQDEFPKKRKLNA